MELAQSRWFSALVHLAQNAGGIASDNCAVGDVFRHYTARPDNRPLANRHATQDGGARADRGPSLHGCRYTRPVRLGLKPSLRRRRAGETVIDKRHAVADEHLIFQRHPLANEGVARDLAPVANSRALLDFHERADLDIIAYFTAVEIGKGKHFDPLAEFHIRRDTPEGLVWIVHSSQSRAVPACGRGDYFRVVVPIPSAVSLPLPLPVGSGDMAIRPVVAVS